MFHKIIIVGRLGADPEQKYTVDGKAVTSFSVAAENRKDETLWFRVSTWDKQAETCNQYLHKGSKVLVEGALRADGAGNPRVYERKDGLGWAASFEVVASSVKFLSGKDEPADQEIAF
mgnify:CR=1 FL=1